MTIADARYMSFTTFRRSGEAVATPGWVAPLDDGRVGFTTKVPSGKVKRLAHTARVVLQPSDSRGRVADGAPSYEGTAVVVQSGADYEAGVAALRRKYGLSFRAVHLGSMIRRWLRQGDNGVVVVTLS